VRRVVLAVVGGGVGEEEEDERPSGAQRRAAPATIRCSIVGEAGPGAAGRLAEDPYRTLRVRPGATRGEVKKAFRRLALMVRAQPLI
jgi:hypothetical protein